ncbi:MAG: 50S ribosomal protein L11 methyltransferase [Pseudomonadota bacterium]
MKWHEISIECEEDLAEVISDYLVEITGRGIVLEDLESDGSRLPMQRVKAYLPFAEASADKMTALTGFLEGRIKGSGSVAFHFVQDEDWAHNWKAFFKPLRLTQRIVVKPSWEEFIPGEGDIVLDIDPGMAFGTGQHPSTHLCIGTLEDLLSGKEFRSLNPEIRVLDVGTGTGILGMAAAGLGADYVLGIDVDPEAVESASKNVYRTGLGNRMVVNDVNLADISEEFTIVLANIVYRDLVVLCPLLSKRVKKGGVLILSGILGEEKDDLFGGYEAEGFSLQSVAENGGWACLVMSRNR